MSSPLHGFIDIPTDGSPLASDWHVQKTAQRLLHGKHRPSLAKWSITKEYGEWEVRKPFALRSTFNPYPHFDTYDEAREHFIEQIASGLA